MKEATSQRLLGRKQKGTNNKSKEANDFDSYKGF